MKKLILILTIFLSFNCLYSQYIPYGESQDSVVVYTGEIHYLYYYKPLNYDSINSPILLGIHGQGGNGYSEIPDLKNIADRRKALIVSPTMHSNWPSGTDINNPDTSNNCFWWYTKVLSKIYRHILCREERDSIPAYLIGFSAGGQFVTRYMLIRQGEKDSIPIVMAVSTNPYFYTFCTETLNGEDMFYNCGLKWGIYMTPTCNPDPNFIINLPFACDEHIMQYYNENYAVLIGTADTVDSPFATCVLAQGNNRYERAINFYAFSDTDAVNRGTTLKWQYGEVPGVAHDQNLMYNTILAGDSIPLAERLLFETPYHNVPYFPPSADFSFEVSEYYCNQVSFKVSCINNVFPPSVFWNFGDGNTSTDIAPTHTYQDTGTYQIELNIWNEIGNNSSADIVTISKFPPVADFTADTTIAYLPVPIVQFQNNSIGADIITGILETAQALQILILLILIYMLTLLLFS